MRLAVFSHGKESGPNGEKIKMMLKIAQKHNHKAVALDYTTCKNAKERIALLKEYLQKEEYEDLLLVGSSMGGYISTVVSQEFSTQGLFLLCPALYMNDPEYEHSSFNIRDSKVEVIHGWNDEVVPFENSIKFCNENKASLNLVNDSHRLKNSLELIGNRFKKFCKDLNWHYIKNSYYKDPTKMHSMLFGEETDFMCDSMSDASNRKFGRNPMSKDYQEKVNEKRALLGVSPLTAAGLSSDSSSLLFCEEESKAYLQGKTTLKTPFVRAILEENLNERKDELIRYEKGSRIPVGIKPEDPKTWSEAMINKSYAIHVSMCKHEGKNIISFEKFKELIFNNKGFAEARFTTNL